MALASQVGKHGRRDLSHIDLDVSAQGGGVGGFLARICAESCIKILPRTQINTHVKAPESRFRATLALRMKPIPETRRKKLLDDVAAGQRSGIRGLEPSLNTRLKAFKAYDELREAEPEQFPPIGRRKRFWDFVARLKGHA